MTSVTKCSNRWTPLGITALVLGFIVWWPVGLAALFYILWGGSFDDLAARAMGQLRSLIGATTARRGASSGNTAFDAYREETLRRLEEEQAEFNDYVQKLREARDRQEFDLFMKERKL